MKAVSYPIEETKHFLESFRSVTILTHINPDGDTLGTGLGIYNLLRQKKRQVEIVNLSKELPRYLDFLPGYDRIKRRADFSESLIICCDSASPERLGMDIAGRTVINIDHHRGNHMYGTLNCVVPDAASASEVAYRLFKEIMPVSKDAAVCFYVALVSDTRYFTTASVNAELFAFAKELIDLGVDPAKVSYHFTQRRSLTSLRILQRALGRLRLYKDAKIASMYVTHDDIKATGAYAPDMEGIVDYARSLATVEIGIFAVKTADGIRVSLRSKTVDISAVAEAFGGGGHKVAAGFVMRDCKIEESIEIILRKINELGLLNEA